MDQHTAENGSRERKKSASEDPIDYEDETTPTKNNPDADNMEASKNMNNNTTSTKNKPAAQAAGADPSRCNSTNRQNPPLQ